jgi:hypothetical protein
MAPIRNATAACGRLESGDTSNGSPGPDRNGRVDPTPSYADRRFPDPLRNLNMTDAAIMDKSGNTPPNIGHFP